MRKTLIISALVLTLLFVLPGGVVLVPALRTTAVESVTQIFLSADRVSIGAIEVGNANDVVVSNTAVQTARGRVDVGRVAMTPQLWRGLWKGQGPLDYVNQVRVENVAGSFAAFGSDVPVRLVDLTVQDRAQRHAVAVTAQEATEAVEEADPAAQPVSEETTTVLRSRLLVRGQSIDIEVELDARKLIDGKPTDFTATVTADLLRLEAQGTVRDPKALEVEGDFVVKTGALDELVAWIIGEAPPSLAGLGSFDGEGRLSMKGELVRLADLRLDLIDSQVRGDITITRGEDVTGLDGQLAIDRIDLNRLMAAMPAGSEPASESTEPAAVDVAFLDGLRGLLRISVAELLAGPAVASDLGLTLKFQPGELQLAALSKLFGGEISLESTVRSDDGAPDAAATLKLAGLKLQQAVTAASGPDSGLAFDGVLGLDAQASARGATVAELEKSLSASLSAVADGLNLTAGADVLRDGRLELKADGLDRPVALAGNATVFSRPLSVLATAASPNQLSAGLPAARDLVRMELSSGVHRIESRIVQSADGAPPVLRLAAQGRSLADLVAWLQGQPAAADIETDPIPNVLGAYSLGVDVQDLTERVALSALTLQVDDVRLDGSGALELSGEKPKIMLSLAGDTIDVTPYMSADAGLSGDSAAETSETDAEAELGGLAVLETLDARFELRLNGVTADRLKLGAAAMTATVQDGAAAAEVEVSDVYGGEITLHAGVRGVENDLPVDARLAFQGIDPGNALRTMFDVDGFGGSANGELRLATNGNRLSELQQRLEANGRFFIEDAEVPPQFALLSGNPLTQPADGEQASRISGVLLYGRDNRRADMQWQRGDDVVAEFSLFEKKKQKRETRLTIPDQRDG